jgi:peptide/nickel transport system substrate-binding protein
MENLTDRDLKTYELKGVLADKWEQKDAKTWRFTLKKGIKYQDGSDFNAQTAADSINRDFSKDLNGKIRGQMGPQITAIAVDATTLDVVTDDTDPIIPLRMMLAPIFSSKFAKETPEEMTTKAVGTGPYQWVEWVRGQYVKLTANENYWGPVKPSIKDIVFLWRAESIVRSAMVKTGEAQLAYFINPQDVKSVPKAVPVSTIETAIIRADCDHPILKDKRIRQAMNYAIDRQAIVDTIYSGYATPAAQMPAPAVTGHNPNLKPYPYDPAKAKSLMQEAGYKGEEIAFYSRLNHFNGDKEMWEAIVNWWTAVGFKIKHTPQEYAKGNEMLFSVAPGARGPLVTTKHGVELGDASRSFDSYLRIGGRISTVNDPKLDAMGKAAVQIPVGPERTKALQDMFTYLYDEIPVYPIIHLQFIFGMAKNLEWEPRADGFTKFGAAKFTE